MNEKTRVYLDKRKPFDYTKWRESLWKGKTVREISADAMEYRKKNEQDPITTVINNHSNGEQHYAVCRKTIKNQNKQGV